MQIIVTPYLYELVSLPNGPRVDQLLRTLKTRPILVSLVLALAIWAGAFPVGPLSSFIFTNVHTTSHITLYPGEIHLLPSILSTFPSLSSLSLRAVALPTSSPPAPSVVAKLPSTLVSLKIVQSIDPRSLLRGNGLAAGAPFLPLSAINLLLDQPLPSLKHLTLKIYPGRFPLHGSPVTLLSRITANVGGGLVSLELDWGQLDMALWPEIWRHALSVCPNLKVVGPVYDAPPSLLAQLRHLAHSSITTLILDDPLWTPLVGVAWPPFPIASFVELCVQSRKLYLPSLSVLRCDHLARSNSRDLVEIKEVLQAAVGALAAEGFALVDQNGQQFVF